MNNAFLRKYVQKEGEAGDYLHSSGYARVQSGDGVGAAGGGVRERLAADERKFVKGYGDSSIMGGARKMVPGAKVYVPPVAKPVAGGGAGAKPAGGRPVVARPPISRP